MNCHQCGQPLTTYHLEPSPVAGIRGGDRVRCVNPDCPACGSSFYHDEYNADAVQVYVNYHLALAERLRADQVTPEFVAARNALAAYLIRQAARRREED